MGAHRLRGLLAIAVSCFSAHAMAYTDTAFFRLGRLEAASGSFNGLRAYPAAGYALPNPDGCANADYAEVQSTGPTSGEKELMNRSLTAAFLANKRVRLRLDGCGATNRPAYRLVSLRRDQ